MYRHVEQTVVSVWSSLLRTLITVTRRTRSLLACTCFEGSSLKTVKTCFVHTMTDRDAARALNSLARESLDLLGSADGPALSDFLHEYFCGDDPAYDAPGKVIYTLE